MKKIIFTLAMTTLIAGAILTGCQSSTDKVINAEEKERGTKNKGTEEEADLYKMKQDSITAEYHKFRKESEEKIIANEKSIAEFKTKIATEKKEIKAIYEKKLAALEQKNNDLKKKLADYKEESNDKWEIFKTEFKRDMDEFGKAFKDLTVMNANK
jgi:hypothetical protein